MVNEERRLGSISAVQVVGSINILVLNTALERATRGWEEGMYIGGAGGMRGPHHYIGGGTDTLAASNAFQLMVSSTHVDQVSILNTAERHKLWTMLVAPK